MRLLSISEKDGRLRYFLTNLAYLFALAWPIEAAISNKISFAILIPVALVALFLYISSGVRRCNDIGVPGWLLFAYFVPLVNIAAGAYLTFAPSGAGLNKRIAAYCGGLVVAAFGLGILVSAIVTNDITEEQPSVLHSIDKPEATVVTETITTAPSQPPIFQQQEIPPASFLQSDNDAYRQAELVRQADAERHRRNMEIERERERFYAKQYAERDVVKCELKRVMTDAEIAACRSR